MLFEACDDHGLYKVEEGPPLAWLLVPTPPRTLFPTPLIIAISPPLSGFRHCHAGMYIFRDDKVGEEFHLATP
jgi:hypothetical protein